MSPAKFTKTLGTLFKKEGFSKGTDKVAVSAEFENEFKSGIVLPPVEGFAFHPDSSLRLFGFEYVSSPPSPDVPSLIKSCTHLFKALNAAKGNRKFTNSIRTSTHVHFDVTQYTYPQLYNFLCVYWTLEELLSFFCGQQRQGNLFTLRLKDSSFMKLELAKSIEKREPSSASLLTGQYRYASANLNAIPKFGSLEFRLMRGVDNVDDAATWINALESIRTFALKFEHPGSMYDYFLNKDSACEFPVSVLGAKQAKEFLRFTPWSSEDLKNSIQNGFMHVLPIIAGGKSWDFTEEVKEAERRQAEFQAEQDALPEDERHNFRAQEIEDVLLEEIHGRPPLPAQIPRVAVAGGGGVNPGFAARYLNVAPPIAINNLEGQVIRYTNPIQLLPDFDNQDQLNDRNIVLIHNWSDE